ncbi:ABC transporter substrate-binding protein [Roseibium sp. M-1]
MNTTRRNFLLTTAVVGLLALPNSWSATSATASEADHFNIAISKQPGNLDPHRYMGLWAVQSIIFEPLVKYSSDGSLQPALAESWDVSEDGKALTFHLRPDVVFSDGTPWNAEAMTWNLDRWIGSSDHSWLSISAQFDRYEVIDDMTVAIHLKEPAPAALSELTVVRPVRFLSPASVAADGSYQDAVGTGPFVISRNDQEGATLVHNESYWGAEPTVETIELIVMPNSRSRVDGVRSGQIDAVGGQFLARVSPQEAETLKHSGLSIATAQGTDTMVLGFNPERPLFQDKRIREAIALSIDRILIADRLMKGFAQPTANLFPAVVPLSGKRYDVPERDLERAKALLEEAGWTGDGIRQKDGQPLAIELVISEDAVPGSRALGEVLQSFVREAGVELSLRMVDHASRHDDIPQMKYDVALFVTTGAPYDPYASLPLYFSSAFLTGTDGKMFMDKEELDPLIDAAMMAQGDEREVAFQAFNDWLHDNTGIVPLYHPDRIWVHSPRVVGFEVPATEYELPYSGISIKGDH